jgi:hypothetical protein
VRAAAIVCVAAILVATVIVARFCKKTASVTRGEKVA